MSTFNLLTFNKWTCTERTVIAQHRPSESKVRHTEAQSRGLWGGLDYCQKILIYYYVRLNITLVSWRILRGSKTPKSTAERTEFCPGPAGGYNAPQSLSWWEEGRGRLDAPPQELRPLLTIVKACCYKNKQDFFKQKTDKKCFFLLLLKSTQGGPIYTSHQHYLSAGLAKQYEPAQSSLKMAYKTPQNRLKRAKPTNVNSGIHRFVIFLFHWYLLC